jgi:hypothetical protein
MNDLSILPNSDSASDNTPLPLIVAKRWNFPLAYVETPNGNLYAVQDWMRGLSGEHNVSTMWGMLKKTVTGKQTFN